MIVGLTGTGLPFPRLLRGLADYARSSGEEVWVQHGAADRPTPLQGEPLVPRPELLARMRAARVVVCHGGCGSIADALVVGRVPVVVPRRAAHGEHVNDHQLELVEALSAEGRIVAVSDVLELPAAIEKAARMQPTVAATQPGDALRASLSRELRRRERARARRTSWVWKALGAAAWLASPQRLVSD